MSLRYPSEDEDTPITICPVCRRMSSGIECQFCPRNTTSFREHLAALAMVVLLRDAPAKCGPTTRAADAFQVAEASVEYADALIDVLKRSKKE